MYVVEGDVSQLFGLRSKFSILSLQFMSAGMAVCIKNAQFSVASWSLRMALCIVRPNLDSIDGKFYYAVNTISCGFVGLCVLRIFCIQIIFHTKYCAIWRSIVFQVGF